MKTNKEKANCVSFELCNLISEFKSKELTEETLVDYVSTILRDAGVNSDIVIDVLEREQFGAIGKEAARTIKIIEGY